jgi:hypothetical protein
MKVFYFSHIAMALADSLSIKKCNCATDTAVGFLTSYKINGNSTGLPASEREMWRFYALERDDLLFPQKQGMLCTPEGLPCRRVPSISQYFSLRDVSPSVATDACVRTSSGHDYCAAFQSLKIDHEWKWMPTIPSFSSRFRHISHDECEGYCKSLWPTDNTTFPLCAYSERRTDHPHYGSLFLSGRGEQYFNDADACWVHESLQWDWNQLRSWHDDRPDWYDRPVRSASSNAKFCSYLLVIFSLVLWLMGMHLY